ncbi:MAG: M1 family aminopeptidase, partial [Candidatus Neomarinimicrobiota bacterium]
MLRGLVMVTRTLLFILLSFSVYAQNALIHHDISATIKPSDSFIAITDVIIISETQLGDGLEFKLHHALEIAPNKMITKLDKTVDAEDIGMDKDDVGSENALKLNVYKVNIPSDHKSELKLTLKYKGKIDSPVKQSDESYARGFSESPGIIWEKGVYLAGSTYWIPYFNNELVSFNLTTTAPIGWKTVTIGKRILDEKKENTHIDKWESPTPQEEVFLIAAPFNEYSFSMGAVTAYAFLRTPDEGIANKYLETTAQYMEMYRKLIGPFPYTKFALVENFWETGYGMPSFTLLGEKIIRFPFILHSSYPHELLHNWWGNSVYVDFETGNWCEGLTAYLADHLIKEQRGQADEYRRGILQKYTNYVTPENDFPLNRFRSRHDSPSEAIGYGKTSIVFHMLRRKVGDEQFIKGIQVFNRNNKFNRASFDDIRVAFEDVTNEDLKWFFKQWIDRIGAPEVVLDNVKVKRVKDFNNVTFTLEQIQDNDVFYLDVPVTIVTEDGKHSEIVEMNEKKARYSIFVKEKPLNLMIDPQFDLFRKLDPRESPPTFTKAYGAEQTLIVLPPEDSKDYHFYRDFSDLWIEGQEDKFTIEAQDNVDKLPTDKAIMLLGLDNKFAPLVNNALKKYGSELLKDGVRYGKRELLYDDNSFFISIVNPNDLRAVITFLSIGNKDAVEGLNRKLPHYGKYSYLAFSGSEPTNIDKGQWSVNNSPLVKNIDHSANNIEVKLETRKALATLAPVFSADRMMEIIEFLASDDLKGRGIGTLEIDKAA